MCDARAVFATAQRFPMADEVVNDWPHRYLAKVGEELGPRDAVCVLTHDHKFDVPAIIAALETDVGYIGAMGSRRTHTDRVERLREEGVDDATLDRVMAPIGLDLGARDVPVRLLHRPAGDRIGGLAGAVTAGLRSAAGRFVIVMDSDLQHPPELVPILRDTLRVDGSDLVVASRYCGDGDSSGLGDLWRRVISSGSTVLARILFPRRVGRHCTDPMTGFFGVDCRAIEIDRLRPRGFKILLEIMARHPMTVVEVPFVFGERRAGESKASGEAGDGISSPDRPASVRQFGQGRRTSARRTCPQHKSVGPCEGTGCLADQLLTRDRHDHVALTIGGCP